MSANGGFTSRSAILFLYVITGGVTGVKGAVPYQTLSPRIGNIRGREGLKPRLASLCYCAFSCEVLKTLELLTVMKSNATAMKPFFMWRETKLTAGVSLHSVVTSWRFI